MFIKAMFILWVIIQSETYVSVLIWTIRTFAELKVSLLQNSKKNIRYITVLSTLNGNLHNKDTTSFPGFSVSCFVGTSRRGNWERGVNKDKPLLLGPFQMSNFYVLYTNMKIYYYNIARIFA